MTPPTDTAPEAPPAADNPAADRLRGRLMARSLQVLLDQVRGSREAMPHLAALEVALLQRGPACIDEIQPHLLARMHSQLRVLPVSSDDAALSDLSARLQQARRRHAPQQTLQLAPFDPEATVVISEGSHTDFMNALEASRDAR
jgi:hypothetical protein